MELSLFRTLWGVQQEMCSYVDALRQAGFVGVEARVPLELEARRTFKQSLKELEMKYIAILFSGGDVIPNQAESPDQHLARLAEQLDFAAELEPKFVNVLPGNDRWTMTQQVDFFGRAHELAKEKGVFCSFETHRATSLYSPWVTLELIRQLPEVRYTADISHWVLVCERLLNDPVDDLSRFIERVHHIQARVGYPQGPQTPHPGAPEYKEALQFHQNVWQAIWQKHLDAGRTETTMTTEFGADGYLHHLPFTNVPVADLWALNEWMAVEERAHFERFIHQHHSLLSESVL